MPRYALVLTTLAADTDADALARILVDERLVACVNLLPPMRSIYRWEGKIETATERQLIMKTSSGRLEELKSRLAALHPYEVPEILVIGIHDGGQSYLDWVSESTRESRD